MVPEGWNSSSIESVSEHVKVGFVGSCQKDYRDTGVPLIRTTNLKDGLLDLENIIYVTEEFHQKNKKSQLREYDLLIARHGNHGSACMVPEGFQNANCLNIVVVRPDRSKVSPEFLLDLFNFSLSKKLSSKAAGSTQSVVNTKEIASQTAQIPPLPEQQKIARILSTWDKAITNTEKRIDNSKQQKKALMQQLLTGKKRFPGFEGEWEDKHLNEVAEIIVSPVDKKTVEGETPVKLCNYTDVYYNTRITKTLNFMKATAKQSEIDKYTLLINDVIVTKDSETPGDIAVPALVSEDLEGVVCGYHLAIIRPDEKLVEGAFLNYLFSMPITRYYFFTLATGATRFGLSVGGINKAHFTLPPLEEQQKIASVLTNADKEIELLEQQLADLKHEKKALMQQLLTGKRRVLV